VYWVQPSCWNKDRLTETLEMFVQSKFKAVCSWYEFKTEFGEKLRSIVDNLKKKITGEESESLKFVVDDENKYTEVETFSGKYQEPDYRDMSEEQQKQVHRQVRDLIVDLEKRCTVAGESKENV
jgi:ATP phosphoribosyltransferase